MVSKNKHYIVDYYKLNKSIPLMISLVRDNNEESSITTPSLKWDDNGITLHLWQ